MKYGILLNSKINGIKINSEILEKKGYRQVPNHCDGMQVDEQWISNALGFEAKFPRFHIIKNERQYYLHYDYFVKNEDKHRTCIKKSPEIMAERARLAIK